MSITPERAKKVGSALLVTFFLQGTVGTVIIPRIPQLIDQLQVNFTAWGAIIGFSGLGALVGLMFANRLIVSFGSRRILQVMALAFSLLLVPLPYLTNPWLFFLLQAATAFSGACLNVALNAQAVVLQRHINRTIVPKFHGAWSVGAASSAALSAYLASFMPMWLNFLIVPGAIASALFWATSRAFTNDEIGRVNDRKAGKKVPFWKSPAQLWIISIGWFAGVFPEAAVMDWSTVFGRKVLLLDTALSAVPYTFFVAAMIICRLSIARLTKNVHVGLISFWGGIFGTVAMGIAVIFGPMISSTDKIAGMFFTAAFLFVAGLGIGPMSPSFTAASGQIKGLSTAQGLARASLVSSVLMMSAKVIMGAIAQNVNLTIAFMLPTAFFLLAALISGALARGDNRSKPVVDDAFPITGSIAIIPADE
jgi:MFS family permease